MNVELPNGVIIEDVPEGETREQVLQKAVSAGLIKPEELPQTEQPQVKEPSTEEASAWRRALYGAGEPIDAVAQMLYNALPEEIQQAGDKLDTALYESTGGVIGSPLGTFNEDLAAREQQYRAQAPETDVARLAGNIGTIAAATRKVPSPDRLSRLAGVNAGVGGAAGALTPVYDIKGDFWSQKAKQLGAGALVGAALSPLTFGLGRLISPKTAQNPDVKALKEAGVHPTIGQAVGGHVGQMEQRAQSLPLTGDFIRGARKSALDEYNAATLNKVLEPLGQKVSKIGSEGVDEASRLVSSAYDKALTGMKGFRMTPEGINEIQSLRNLARGMPKDVERQFNWMLNNRVLHRMSPGGGFEARTFKQVESDIGKKIASTNDQELKGALKELQDILRREASKANPQYAGELQRANEAFARLVRVQDAANRSATREGVFTPGQLLMSTRKADTTARKSASARGNALLQDWARTGQQVLGDTYPDSGTAGRLMDAGAILSGTINPWIPGGLLGAGMAYTKPAQKALGLLATQRGPGAEKIARMVRKSAPLLVPLSMPVVQPFLK